MHNGNGNDNVQLTCERCRTSENVIDISDAPIHTQRGDGELIDLFFVCENCLIYFYRLSRLMAVD